jgi:hypothetical protein
MVMKGSAARNGFEERTSAVPVCQPGRGSELHCQPLQRFVESADCLFFVEGGTLCELTEFLTCFTHTAVVAVEMK